MTAYTRLRMRWSLVGHVPSGSANQPAVRLYRKLGFEVVERLTEAPGTS